VPTYSYTCTQCHHGFDQRQDFQEPALTDCPECSGLLRKRFGSVGVVFKGSGFYRTDSRSGRSKSGSVRSSGRPDTSETKTGAASEAKTGAASEAKTSAANETKTGATNCSGGAGAAKSKQPATT